MTAKTAQAFQHLPLFDEPQPWQTDIYRRRMELNVLVQANPSHFRKDFANWLAENFEVWEAFSAQADKILASGRRRARAVHRRAAHAKQ